MGKGGVIKKKKLRELKQEECRKPTGGAIQIQKGTNSTNGEQKKKLAVESSEQKAKENGWMLLTKTQGKGGK